MVGVFLVAVRHDFFVRRGAGNSPALGIYCAGSTRLSPTLRPSTLDLPLSPSIKASAFLTLSLAGIVARVLFLLLDKEGDATDDAKKCARGMSATLYSYYRSGVKGFLTPSQSVLDQDQQERPMTYARTSVVLRAVLNASMTWEISAYGNDRRGYG
jgi:hypothetical protein